MPVQDCPELRKAVIQDIIQLTREKYVYPELGDEIADQIQTKLDGGGYDGISDGNELALRLTTDLRAFSKDHHWGVVYDPDHVPEQVDPEAEEDDDRLEGYLAMARKNNFGFEKVERLTGNIGYIDLRRFEPSEYGGQTAVAAMNFVTNCDVLIFDLRQNHGGYPSMVQLIISYLLEAEPVHINTFYYRPKNIVPSPDGLQQFWTFPHVPGKRMPEIPVYVLTSSATGSGAEEFAYNLKHMERATLIGETTVGAAHPVTKEVVQDHFDVRLPYGRPINPITQGNWEGTGVEPHLAVPAEEALKTAHIHALGRLIDECDDGAERSYLDWVIEIVESDYSLLTLEDDALLRCAGVYGERTFTVEDGALVYGHQDLPISWKLMPMTGTRFRLDEDMKFEFILNETGTASSVLITYRDGRPGLSVDKIV
jgi:hypothetical protein